MKRRRLTKKRVQRLLRKSANGANELLEQLNRDMAPTAASMGLVLR